MNRWIGILRAPGGTGSRVLALAALFGAVATAGAQVIVLDDFLVTASSRPGAAQAITSGRIATHKPVDLAEILSRENASVSLVRKGPVAGDLLLRGLGRDNLRITIDGCAVHGACPNRMDPPAFHVGSAQVERIVVRSGPFDVEDAGAIGGVIRLQTRDAPSEWTAEATALAGSFSHRSASVATGGAAGAWRGQVSMQWQEGGVYRDGQGRRFTELPGLNYRAGAGDGGAFSIFQAEGRVSLAAGPAGGRLTLAGGYHRADDVLYPGLRMDALLDESWRAGFTWSAAPGAPWAEKVEVQASASAVYHDMRDSLRASSLAWAERGGFMMRTLAWTEARRLRATAETTGGAVHLRYGIDASERVWKADNLIMNAFNPMLPDVLARSAGAFAVASREGEDWGWEAGARLDAGRTRARGSLAFVQAAQGTQKNARSDVLPSGYLIGRRNLGPTLVYAGLGHASRAPDPQERYQNHNHPAAGDWVGDPRLGPVRTTELQAGAARAAGSWRLRATAFHAWLDDYVYLARLAPAPGSTAHPSATKTYAGIEARLWGGDFSATWQPAGPLSCELGLAGQRGTKGARPAGNASRVLGEIPEWQARAAVQWEESSWSGRVELQGAPRQHRVDASIGERPLDGWLTVRLVLSHRIGRSGEVTLGVDNLFDASVVRHNAYTRDPFSAGISVPEPGRFLFARFSARM